MFLPAVQYNNNHGLNGFFGRLAKRLIASAISMIKLVPIIGKDLGNELESSIEDWTNNWRNDFWKNNNTPEYEPTPAEEAIIEPWFNSRVLPFYNILSTQLSRAFQQSTPQAQIEAINKVMTKICVAKEYHKMQNVAGLSKSAITWRTGVLDEILLPLENLITTSVSKISGVVMENANATATAAAVDFSGLINLAGFNLANYTCKNYRLTNANVPVIAPVITVPPAQGEPAKEVVIPVSGNPATPEAQAKSKSVLPIIIGGVASYLLLDALTAKKKSK